MGIPDHLTSLLRNLYAGQEATVRTERGTMDWFQIGKGVCSKLFYTRYCICFHATLSICLPPALHAVYVFIAALQIGSSVPSS